MLLRGGKGWEELVPVGYILTHSPPYSCALLYPLRPNLQSPLSNPSIPDGIISSLLRIKKKADTEHTQ